MTSADDPTAQPNDESTSEGTTIFVRVYINKDFTRTTNFDDKRDVWKLAEVDKDTISIKSLREDIPSAFRNTKKFQKLWNNEQYEWKIYGFSLTTADIEIEEDDDLRDEMDRLGFLSSDDSSDADDADDSGGLNNESKFFKVRVVFFDSMSYVQSSPYLRVVCHVSDICSGSLCPLIIILAQSSHSIFMYNV